jgi:hypothetical protein
METIEIIGNLATAYCKVIARDRHLIKVSANERSIAHRFAIYIEQCFPGYNVDCDYNKNLENQKRSPAYAHPTKSGRESDLVLPDIIVHKRNTNDNLVVIELKPTGREETCTVGNHQAESKCLCDRCKLKAIKDDLRYSHAFYVVFPVGAKLGEFKLSKLDDYIQAI